MAVGDLPQRIPLDGATDYTVGRELETGSRSTLIQLSSAAHSNVISRRHATLCFSTKDDAWQVVDQKSTNGLLVNGRRVLQALLQHGNSSCASCVVCAWARVCVRACHG